MPTPEGYRPSTNEIASQAEASAEASKERRAKEAKTKTIKQRAAMVAAGLAAAAAIKVGVGEATVNKPELPNNRYTPEKAATQHPDLTPEQLAEKEAQDAAIRTSEQKIAEEAIKPQEIPDTVKNQNFDGLDTTKID